MCERAFRKNTVFSRIGALAPYFNINFRQLHSFEGALTQKHQDKDQDKLD